MANKYEREPEEGIWYLLPGKELMVEFGSDCSHLLFWINEITPHLKAVYALTVDEAMDVEACPYGLPHGRVTVEDDHAYIVHAQSDTETLRDVIEQFQLCRHMATQRLHITDSPLMAPFKKDAAILKGIFRAANNREKLAALKAQKALQESAAK